MSVDVLHIIKHQHIHFKSKCESQTSASPSATRRGCDPPSPVGICNPRKGIPSRLSAADINPRSRRPPGDDPCSKEPRNRVAGDGRESMDGANERGFKGGDGGKREGAGPEGDGGGSSECKLLP
jgi:hypothetical protein